MGNIPLALQAYSIREDCAKDLAGTLAAGGKNELDQIDSGVEFGSYGL